MADSTRARAGSAHNRADSAPDLNAPSLFINRELSLLQFQHRVLAQARDPRHPLLERLKFIPIVSKNLDEFFMVRISDLLDQIDSGVADVGRIA